MDLDGCMFCRRVGLVNMSTVDWMSRSVFLLVAIVGVFMLSMLPFTWTSHIFVIVTALTYVNGFLTLRTSTLKVYPL